MSIAAALVALFGLVAPATTAIQQAVGQVPTYVYDSTATPTPVVADLPARGPPRITDDSAVLPPAVANSSRGASAHPQSSWASTYIAYDHPVRSVETDSGSGTTWTASGDSASDTRVVPTARVAANAGSKLLSPSSLADEVASATGGVLKTSKNGFTVEIPNGSRGITVRVMERGGERTNYNRASVPGKATYTVTGEASTDAALTHIDIGESSFDDILSTVQRIQGAG
ncbi:hypothetical protein [Nocardioides sp. MH1]|uniref:hypothetical protein n=1 Tax=Nocardioides sp. MH1 TaxID=3242490 RepID=UPI003522D5A9